MKLSALLHKFQFAVTKYIYAVFACLKLYIIFVESLSSTADC